MSWSGDTTRNTIAGGSLVVSLAALVIASLGFTYQYRDSMITNIRATGFAVKELLTPTKNAQGTISVFADHLTGGLSVTFFNSGNRAVSINETSVYLQPGDYTTLIGINPTPPCKSSKGSRTLWEANGSELFGEARVIDAQKILSIPINFPMFSPPDLTGVTEQGIVCLKVRAFNYKGTEANIQYPVGIVQMIQGNPSSFKYVDPRGSIFGDIRSVFP